MNGTVHDLWTLTRLRYKLLVRSALNRYTRGARRAAPFRFLLALFIGVWILTALVVPADFLLTTALHGDQGRRDLTSWLAIASSGTIVLVFFYATLTLVGTFTYRSDLHLLLLTPISPRTVLASKIGGVSLGFSALLLVTVPGLVAIGNDLRLGIPFFLMSILVIVLVPVAPVSAAALLVLAILRFVRPAHARTATTIAGTLMGIALFIGQQAILRTQRSIDLQPGSPPLLPDVLPTTWLGRALADTGLAHLDTALVYAVGAVVVTAALLALATETGARLFATGSASYQEVARRKRASRPRTVVPFFASQGAGGSRPVERRPAWWPLLRKEWLLLRRDSQRLAALSYPIFISGFYLWQLFSLHGSHNAAAPGPVFGSLYGVLIVSSILLLNSTAPSIVNREGGSLYLLALAPLSAREILLSKWVIALLPPLVIVEALLLAGAVILSLGAGQLLIIALTVAALLIALTGVSITVNLMWPKLEFVNPRQQASRIASLVGMVSEFALGFCVFGLLSLAFVFWPNQPAGTAAVLLLLCAVLGGITSASVAMSTRLLNSLLVSDRRAR
ncbi:MAG: hypothetical protein NVS4B2_21510 [Chloroflexota bacterium]